MKDKLKSKPAPLQPAAKAGGKPSTAAAPGTSTTTSRDPDESFEYLAPPQNKDEIGRLGNYRILKVLGRGGMGVVFLAEDSRLNRLVALKVMLPSVAVKRTARERFKREALATAKIEHDHIVTIYEVNEDSDLPFLAMQVLKGMTLDDWLKTGKLLKDSQIMRIGKEIAKGLAAAHACQLIHRDIKPSNIWLDAANKGRVKILDFGLARPTHDDTELTHQGTVIGTPAFMSPEQARGQVVDERSDLFSLGCVLYRLCAGRFAFSGNDVMAVLYSINNDVPPRLEKEAAVDIPAGLAQLIHKLLEKKPADRPQSAQAVVDSIQKLEREWLSRAKNMTTKSPAVAAKTLARPKNSEAEAAIEDSAIDESDLTVSAPRSAVKSKVVWIAAGLGLASLAALGLAIALGVGFWIFTNKGQVRFVAADDAVREMLRDGGVTLSDQHHNKFAFKDGEQQIPPGEYTVDLAGLSDKLLVEPAAFSLHRGDTVELKVHLALQDPLLAKLEKLSLEHVSRGNAKNLQQEWAKLLGRPVVETNSIAMKMVLIPAGVFSMGSSPSFLKQQTDDTKNLPTWTDRYLKLARSEVPSHAVRITRPFALGMHEVTVEQFGKFVEAEAYRPEMEKTKKGGTGLENGSITRKLDFAWNRTGFAQTKDYPVANVTWADAEAFCKWLSKKDKKFYRLPTEAEWEFACRAGTATSWHFGNNAAAAGDYMRHLQASKGPNTYAGAQAVGAKLPNDFGLHDMHGNVEEMCADYWSADYYAKSPPEDPTGPHMDLDKPAPVNNLYKNRSFFSKLYDKAKHYDKGRPIPPMPTKGKQPEVSQDKVARGGSFMEIPQAGRSAFRNSLDPTLGHVQVGFRVVCEITLPD